MHVPFLWKSGDSPREGVFWSGGTGGAPAWIGLASGAPPLTRARKADGYGRLQILYSLRSLYVGALAASRSALCCVRISRAGRPPSCRNPGCRPQKGMACSRWDATHSRMVSRNGTARKRRYSAAARAPWEAARALPWLGLDPRRSSETCCAWIQ